MNKKALILVMIVILIYFVFRAIFENKYSSIMSRLTNGRKYIFCILSHVSFVIGVFYSDKVKKVVNKSNYKNPIVRYMTKLENGDQVEETAELTHYIKSAQAANQVIVPSFTTYIHPNERLSLHSAFINLNVNVLSRISLREYLIALHYLVILQNVWSFR